MFKSTRIVMTLGAALAAFALAPSLASAQPPNMNTDESGIVPYRGHYPVARAVVRGADPYGAAAVAPRRADPRRARDEAAFAVPPAPVPEPAPAPMAERRRLEQPGWTLAAYEYETARYYTMLKCRHASHMEQMRQWELLSKAHYALLGRAGGRAIRAAQTRARMTADAARCY